ncbi:MAG: archaellin/type IV pilin N-terminal domain-containing protein [Candidatus Heimdallarchaeaceae archaeon]
MKLIKFKKRAVSPVIATVLLIALVVAAAAIVYLVVIPMLRGDPNLVVISTILVDSNSDKRVDEIKLNYQNLGSAKASITDITLYSYNTSLNWNIDKTLPYSIGANKQDVVTLTADSIIDTIAYPDIVYVQTTYGEGIILTTKVEISSTYSPVTYIYNEDFNSYSDGYVPREWTYHYVASHTPTGTHTIDDWQVYSGTLKMTCNDCAYIILEGTGYNYANVNMSFDLKANDNDELGIIFRWQDDGGKEKYYLVSYTKDHGLSDHFAGDNPQDNYITLSYVEDNTMTVIASAAFSRTDDIWYSYRTRYISMIIFTLILQVVCLIKAISV